MLACANMSQLYESNNNFQKGLAQVLSLHSASSEVMIKQMVLEEMWKQKKECLESNEQSAGEVVSDLMDSIMHSVISQAAQPQKIAKSCSYDEWLVECEKPNPLQKHVSSFVLRDFSISDEGFLEEEEEQQNETPEQNIKQRDIERIDSAKDVEENSCPTKLKEIFSFALDDIDFIEEYLNDESSSDEEDESSSSSQSQ